MTTAAIAFTDQGYELGRRIAAAVGGTIDRCPPGGLGDWTAGRFATHDDLVFIGSSGIAVRAIAPYIVSKTGDPAVVVIDEQGRFAIPLLSGHIGQANRLARQLAALIGATPVVTTATDGRGLFAVDDWATRQGLRVANPGRIKAVSARLLAGQQIRLASDFPIAGPLPPGVVYASEGWDVIVSCRASGTGDEALHLVPPVVTAGIGCRKGISADAIETAFQGALADAGYHRLSVAAVASIDLKAGEPGLAEFCARHGLLFHTFTADALRGVAGDFTASPFVTAVTGVDNVCERAAVLGSGGALVARKWAGGGCTVALALRQPSLRFDESDDDKEK